MSNETNRRKKNERMKQIWQAHANDKHTHITDIMRDLFERRQKSEQKPIWRKLAKIISVEICGPITAFIPRSSGSTRTFVGINTINILSNEWYVKIQRVPVCASVRWLYVCVCVCVRLAVCMWITLSLLAGLHSVSRNSYASWYQQINKLNNE